MRERKQTPQRVGASQHKIFSVFVLTCVRIYAACVETTGLRCDARLRLRVERYEHNSYLVDPASSHMLVSKIKPCMSKYKLTYTVKLRMAH